MGNKLQGKPSAVYGNVKTLLEKEEDAIFIICDKLLEITCFSKKARKLFKRCEVDVHVHKLIDEQPHVEIYNPIMVIEEIEKLVDSGLKSENIYILKDLLNGESFWTRIKCRTIEVGFRNVFFVEFVDHYIKCDTKVSTSGVVFEKMGILSLPTLSNFCDLVYETKTGSLSIVKNNRETSGSSTFIPSLYIQTRLMKKIVGVCKLEGPLNNVDSRILEIKIQNGEQIVSLFVLFQNFTLVDLSFMNYLPEDLKIQKTRVQKENIQKTQDIYFMELFQKLFKIGFFNGVFATGSVVFSCEVLLFEITKDWNFDHHINVMLEIVKTSKDQNSSEEDLFLRVYIQGSFFYLPKPKIKLENKREFCCYLVIEDNIFEAIFFDSMEVKLFIEILSCEEFLEKHENTDAVEKLFSFVKIDTNSLPGAGVDLVYHYQNIVFESNIYLKPLELPLLYHCCEVVDPVSHNRFPCFVIFRLSSNEELTIQLLSKVLFKNNFSKNEGNVTLKLHPTNKVIARLIIEIENKVNEEKSSSKNLPEIKEKFEFLEALNMGNCEMTAPKTQKKEISTSKKKTRTREKNINIKKSTENQKKHSPLQSEEKKISDSVANNLEQRILNFFVYEFYLIFETNLELQKFKHQLSRLAKFINMKKNKTLELTSFFLKNGLDDSSKTKNEDPKKLPKPQQANRTNESFLHTKEDQKIVKVKKYYVKAYYYDLVNAVEGVKANKSYKNEFMYIFLTNSEASGPQLILEKSSNIKEINSLGLFGISLQNPPDGSFSEKKILHVIRLSFVPVNTVIDLYFKKRKNLLEFKERFAQLKKHTEKHTETQNRSVMTFVNLENEMIKKIENSCLLFSIKYFSEKYQKYISSFIKFLDQEMFLYFHIDMKKIFVQVPIDKFEIDFSKSDSNTIILSFTEPFLKYSSIKSIMIAFEDILNKHIFSKYFFVNSKSLKVDFSANLYSSYNNEEISISSNTPINITFLCDSIVLDFCDTCVLNFPFTSKTRVKYNENYPIFIKLIILNFEFVIQFSSEIDTTKFFSALEKFFTVLVVTG